MLCVFLALQVTDGLDGTEFSGGWLTGPLLSMADVGMILFLVAIVTTFLFPRIAAGLGLVSSLFGLPLYCFFVSPLLFASVFARGHEFKVQPVAGFHWHLWPVSAILAVAIASYICIGRITAQPCSQALRD